MKVSLWCIGKTDEAYLKEGTKQYLRRLGNYLTFEYKELATAKGKRSPEQQKTFEKEEILKHLKPDDHLILLDDKGPMYDSPGFAEFLQKKFNSLGSNLVFLSGGAYGFDEQVCARAQGKLSLSKMTFTHQMARLIFLEQLYRAMTILRNEPYHH